MEFNPEGQANKHWRQFVKPCFSHSWARLQGCLCCTNKTRELLLSPCEISEMHSTLSDLGGMKNSHGTHRTSPQEEVVGVFLLNALWQTCCSAEGSPQRSSTLACRAAVTSGLRLQSKWSTLQLEINLKAASLSSTSTDSGKRDKSKLCYHIYKSSPLEMDMINIYTEAQPMCPSKCDRLESKQDTDMIGSSALMSDLS